MYKLPFLALASLVDNFIENWNRDIPSYPLTIAYLKDPQALMKALFQILDRLGIDRDAVLMVLFNICYIFLSTSKLVVYLKIT